MIREFNEYVRECFSEAGEIVIKSMMGGYLVYFILIFSFLFVYTISRY